MKSVIAFFGVLIAFASSAGAVPSPGGDNCFFLLGNGNVREVCIDHLEYLADADVTNGDQFAAAIYFDGATPESPETLAAIVPLTVAVDHIPSVGITSYELKGMSSGWQIYLPLMPSLSGQKEPYHSQNSGYIVHPTGAKQIINRYRWENPEPQPVPPGGGCRFHCH